MDRRGIEHATFGRIPWDDVIGLRHSIISARRSKQHVLNIGVRAPHRFYQQLSWILRRQNRAWASRTTRYGALRVGLNILDKPPELIYEAAVAFRRKVDAPWFDTWCHTMSASSIDTMLAMEDVQRESVRAAQAGDLVAAQAATARLQALQPGLERHVADLAAQARKQKRNAWIIGGLVVLLVALKVWAVSV